MGPAQRTPCRSAVCDDDALEDGLGDSLYAYIAGQEMKEGESEDRDGRMKSMS